MIIRHARASDAEQLESFDIGGSSLWLNEVAEIVGGLLEWRSDPHAADRDRQVVVAVAEGRVVGVTAHERLIADNRRVWNDHRYLMVAAICGEHQRSGLGRLLIESTLAELRATGCESVEWLVHPSNRQSIEFSRSVFPEADETQPPEDHPYLSFAMAL